MDMILKEIFWLGWICTNKMAIIWHNYVLVPLQTWSVLRHSPSSTSKIQHLTKVDFSHQDLISLFHFDFLTGSGRKEWVNWIFIQAAFCKKKKSPIPTPRVVRRQNMEFLRLNWGVCRINLILLRPIGHQFTLLPVVQKKRRLFVE